MKTNGLTGAGMWCAECGNRLAPLDYGGYARCCRGYGYWSNESPLPKDAALYERMHGEPLQTRGGLYLYKGVKWPKGFQPVEVVDA